jgi:hypothetical protein
MPVVATTFFVSLNKSLSDTILTKIIAIGALSQLHLNSTTLIATVMVLDAPSIALLVLSFYQAMNMSIACGFEGVVVG